MTSLTDRLRHMRTDKGQSLHELETMVCDESERLFVALKGLHDAALDYAPSDGPLDNALEEAVSALAAAGDPDAISANEEWAREEARLGLQKT